MTPTMYTSTTLTFTLPSLLPIPSRKSRVVRSPYPLARKSMKLTAPGRRAYAHLKSTFSRFRQAKPVKITNRAATAIVATCGEERVSGGQLALEYAYDTRFGRREMAPTHVPGGQLAPGHVEFVPVEPHDRATATDEYHGWAQVAMTSARFLSTLLGCPETLPSADPTELHPDLAHLISYALYRSQMPLVVHQYALYLIWRMSCLNPDFNPRHAHGTYLTALMLAAKQSHDVEYSIGCWASIGQVIFEPAQLRDNEWRMCERLGWNLLVQPMDLVKLAWTIEVEHGELDEGAPPSSVIDGRSGFRFSGMFAASVASSLSSISTSSSYDLDSPWSGWGNATPSGSSPSTPFSNGPMCGSAFSSPLPSA